MPEDLVQLGLKNPQYSAKVLEIFDRFLSGRTNAGSLDENDPTVGKGQVGNPACGDVMHLYIKVKPETGVIEDARFKTFGCGAAIASASLVTEWLKGKTLDEALQIQNRDIAKELDLPLVKIHCSVLARDAIEGSIADFRKKQEALKAK